MPSGAPGAFAALAASAEPGASAGPAVAAAFDEPAGRKHRLSTRARLLWKSPKGWRLTDDRSKA